MLRLLQNLICCNEISVYSTNSQLLFRLVQNLISHWLQWKLHRLKKLTVCYEMLRLLQNLIGYYEISIHSTNLVVAMKFSVYSRIWLVVMKSPSTQQTHCMVAMKCSVYIISLVIMKSRSTQQTYWLLWNVFCRCRISLHCPNCGPQFTLYTTYTKDAFLDTE